MMRKFLICAAVMISLTAFAAPRTASAHCQIPCGIYHDQMRIDMMNEDIETIEKSMNSINEISAATDKDYNQLVRWIDNKEAHADKIQEIVTEYFMAQRVKLVDSSDQPGHDKYLKQLEKLHHIQVYAMKCKQTTDLANVNMLKKLVKEFADMYFVPSEKPAGKQ
jgi:nickel superoxide dismutase